MARYIDADALIAEYDRVHIGPAGGARKLMVDAPTADVVEVVRCKDCFYCTEEFKKPYCVWFEETTKEDGFCSYGERKDNNG